MRVGLRMFVARTVDWLRQELEHVVLGGSTSSGPSRKQAATAVAAVGWVPGSTQVRKGLQPAPAASPFGPGRDRSRGSCRRTP